MEELRAKPKGTHVELKAKEEHPTRCKPRTSKGTPVPNVIKAKREAACEAHPHLFTHASAEKQRKGT